MPTAEQILRDAELAASKSELSSHLKTIRVLRDKKWSWREIAAFLTERGIETDHTKLIRFMQRHSSRWAPPPAETYYKALVSMRAAGQMRDSWWAMLMCHFNAHNRTVTYTELASAAKQAGARVPQDQPHRFANLEYGTLGKTLGTAAGVEFLQSSQRDKPFYSSAIGAGSSTTTGDEFELVMHHELAKALERLLQDKQVLNSRQEADSNV